MMDRGFFVVLFLTKRFLESSIHWHVWRSPLSIYFTIIDMNLDIKRSLFFNWSDEEFAKIASIIQEDPLFIPFRDITTAMLDFLILEKLHLYMNDGTRKVVDSNGEIISGYLQTFRHTEDEYHPQNFKPFMSFGFWIPEEEGELFLIQEHLETPFRRNNEGRKEVLFLVHPKSEALFSPLTQEYDSKKIEIPSLSLSSFRTLLVSIPGNDGQWTLAFAKLSLDEKINNVSRIISKKESAGSVAATFAFKEKLISMVCYQGDLLTLIFQE